MISMPQIHVARCQVAAVKNCLCHSYLECETWNFLFRHYSDRTSWNRSQRMDMSSPTPWPPYKMQGQKEKSWLRSHNNHNWPKQRQLLQCAGGDIVVTWGDFLTLLMNLFLLAHTTQKPMVFVLAQFIFWWPIFGGIWIKTRGWDWFITIVSSNFPCNGVYSMCVYIYIYIHIKCMCVYIYIYIMCIYTYIMYIYIYK